MVLATGIFTTNCTLPPEGANWVSNPNVRSTLTILWTSLLTIFLCTWTVQHLTIPPPNAPRLANVWRKIKWMMVVIIAPEFMVGKSFSDWVSAAASESCPAMQEHAIKSGTRWTTTHAFYANMGGFLVHGVNCHPALDECTCAVSVPPATRAGSRHSLSPQTSTEPPAITAAMLPTCRDRESNGLASPTPQDGAALESSATDVDMVAATNVPSTQVTPVTDGTTAKPTLAARQGEKSNARTSPTAQPEALLEPSLKEVDIEAAARKVPSAQNTPVVDGNTTTLGNRLKKWILHPKGRNHIWRERPPRNLVDHGQSWCKWCERVNFPFAANSAQLCVLLSSGIIGQLPSITEDQINDKSKEDIVIKILALLQVLQLVVELIIRKVYDLPTSQLEIAALSFSVCAAIVYLLWLRKPKDIQLPTDVYITRDLNDADKEQLSWLNSTRYFKYALSNISHTIPGQYIANDFYNTESLLWPANPSGRLKSIVVLTGEDVGFAVGGLIFGAFHCLAWNFVFPTLIEQTLWRVSSALASASVPLFYIIWYIDPVFSVDRPDRLWPRRVRALLLCAFFLQSIVCRLFIMVEAVRSLFFLPPDAFVSTWSVNIPGFR